MKKKSILILGGYGGVGRSLSRLILKETDVNLIVAGWRKEKAEEFVEIINNEYPGGRVSARYADAADSKSLIDAFQGTDMVVVTATTPQYLEKIAQTAIRAECDYLDILVQQNFIPSLMALSQNIEEAGRMFITQAGFHPGLPAVFIREGANYFDDYRKAIICMAMNTRFEKPESTREIIEGVGESNAEILKDGKWKAADYKDAVSIDFGTKLGIKQCYPLQMEEIKSLPEILGIEETGVYAAGFNWFVDSIVFPLAIILQQIRKGLGVNLLGKMMHWGVNTFSPKEQAIVFVLEAEGEKKGKEVKVKMVAEHHDAYYFTAVPVVACLKQYLDGSLKKPGLWLMGNLVETDRLMKDMEKMGIKIKTEVRNDL